MQVNGLVWVWGEISGVRCANWGGSMKLSTKGRYAVVALCDLALAAGKAAQGEEGLVSLSEISKRQDISLPYLEQLFVKLRRAGLVEAMRGPGGGRREGAQAWGPHCLWCQDCQGTHTTTLRQPPCRRLSPTLSCPGRASVPAAGPPLEAP